MTPNDQVRYSFNVIAETAFTQHHDFKKKLNKKAQIGVAD